MDKLIVKGAREHNLKNISVEIPKNKLVVFTGLSGSGKSSFAFDTIYAEGQRRYVESLSSYARQFLGIMKKPDVDLIEGLSPAISIDQKSTSHNPRSTVGTVTEIYDYMRLLFARIGHPHCPKCGKEISHMSKEQIVNAVLNLLSTSGNKKLRIMVLAPIVKDRRGEYTELFTDLKKRGYKKTRIDNKIYSLDEDFVLIKTNKHTIEAVIDQIVLSKETEKERIAAGVEQGLKLGNGEVIISIIKDAGFSIPDKPKEMQDEFFSEKFACPIDNIFLQEIEPRIFSFNTPHGACPKCNGLGMILTIDRDLIFNDNLTINEGGILPYANMISHDTWFSRTLKIFCRENNIPLTKRMPEISKEKKDLLLNGTGNKEYIVEGENRWGRDTVIHEPFKGVIEDLRKRYESTESVFFKAQVEKFMRNVVCNECNGARLKKEALSVTIEDKSIVTVSDMPIGKAFDFMNSLETKVSKREGEISGIILKEIKQRLSFLIDVGLEYLTLSRGAHTLAGGEAQRIRLASQIGSGLTGVLYVLDEPSIGLHQRDNKKLIDTLKKLRDLGNTVLVVEHDEETMREADLIIDFGPGAGENGGEIVAIGTYDEISKNSNSLTGKYLSGTKKINTYKSTIDIASNNYLVIEGASEHNLKNIDVSFPLNKFVVVTGVSGSGKSTLVNDILYHGLMQKSNPFHKQRPGEHTQILGYEKIKNVFLIDQSPIGRTPRSNPATYTGAFTYIRENFAKSKDAKLKGYGPGRFSFNVKGGRCESCQGEGKIKIEMQFLPDVYVTCEVCNGRMYNNEALEVLFNGKNIYDVLSMSVAEALSFFSFSSGLSHKLQTLNDVGLSYIKLGQSAPTLSGGEAQRVKFSTELSKRGANSLYLLDEPTTGLHFADLEKLLLVLRRLVDQGNTVIVIEHNMDVIKNADYIIDLGPEGGEKGGEIVATGTPEEIVKVNKSYTGQFLKKV
ncbi:MAG: excinuclease ABC subunit UvrA [Candidatus Levybacteria bacterium CG_4_9_14_3_um_filter_35_16]|nr:MAG: excinuclease ABC subunit UvrA [Candidatus Levybacteria bacterium CG_4_10_14_0_8_um_filter_35_23]PJA91530.1 MAG: excinuclease ABC subunit UvrA [Candidatus Levybacteria bacterium CG_4_9_14_3_um_filter_35_16]PJC54813.1 MAG: excinuclease ABC subunit UvrA [Candidatus Levybacteria bacterium CG_4_9_14_0_2_um_filter_35_21]